MRKSVTVLVRCLDRSSLVGLRIWAVDGDHTSFGGDLSLTKKMAMRLGVPLKIGGSRTYTVRYSVDRNGSLQVVKKGHMMPGVTRYGSKKRSTFTCFLPDEWMGLRVRREVI